MRSRPLRSVLLVVLPFILAASSLAADALRLPRANGKSADLLGIWEIWPEGMWVANRPGPAIFVEWQFLDTAALEKSHPALHQLRLRAQMNQWDEPVNLGVYRGVLSPLEAARVARQVLAGSISFAVPPQYRVELRSHLSGFGSFWNSVGDDRRLGTWSGGTFCFQLDGIETRTITRLRPAYILQSVLALCAYAGLSDEARKDAIRLVHANPGQFESLAAELENTLQATQLYPAGALPRRIATASGRRAQEKFAQDARTLGWLNGSIDHNDQLTFVRATKDAAAALRSLAANPDSLRDAGDRLFALARVLDRPMFR